MSKSQTAKEIAAILDGEWERLTKATRELIREETEQNAEEAIELEEEKHQALREMQGYGRFMRMNL